MSSKETIVGSTDLESAEATAKQTNRMMIWWCVGTLLIGASSWFLLKGDGRQLVAAPGELLITMSRPAAIEPPYPVENLGGQWGLLVLGELEEKYERMTLMIGLWIIGAAILFSILLSRMRAVGFSKINRVVLSLAGLAVFAGGVLLLQAALRSGANYQRMAGVDGGVDPFLAAQLLPLSLATKACIWLAVAALLLVIAAGVIMPRKVAKGYSAPSHRMMAVKWCMVLSSAALSVLLAYSVFTLTGPISDMLQVRLDVLTEPRIVNQLNDIWGGLKWSALAVQLGGLLWVVAAWAAPGKEMR